MANRWFFHGVLKLIFFGLFLYVIISTLQITLHSFTEIPQWDEWDVLQKYINLKSDLRGILHFLFLQHNEHRVVTSKIIYLIDITMLKGEGWLQRVLMFVCLIVLSLTFFKKIASQRVDNSNYKIYPENIFVLLAILAIVFSDFQMENFIRGFNDQVYFLITFSMLSINFFLKAIFRNEKKNDANFFFSLSIAFAFLSTYSMSGGILVWAVLPLILVLAPVENKSRIVIFTLLFGFFAVLTYLIGYETVGGHSNPLESASHPVDVLNFLMIFLGNILAPYGKSVAFWFGLFSFVLFVTVLVILVRNDEKRTENNLFFIGLMINSIGLGLLVALGRMKFGIDYGLSSRYVTFTILYWASLLLLVKNVIGLNFPTFRYIYFGFLFSLMVAIAMKQASLKIMAISEYEKYEKGRIALINGVEDTVVLVNLYPDLSVIKKVSAYMEENGLGIFGPYQPYIKYSKSTINEKALNATGDWCEGHVDQVNLAASHPTIVGWAWNKDESKQPDFLIVTNGLSILGVTKDFVARNDVINVKKYITDDQVGFFGYLEKSSADKNIYVVAFSEKKDNGCRIY